MVITGWKEIAGALSVSVRTAQTLRADGLPVFNLSPRRVAVRPVDLSAWIAQRRASLRDVALDGAVSGVAGDRA